MAAGKVRCGACLSVFQAREHFVDIDADSNADETHESVFIGNDPEDFFDPTVFLTRSALQADQANSRQPELTGSAVTTNPDFSTASDAEIPEHEEPRVLAPESEEAQDSDTFISAAQAIAPREATNPVDNMAGHHAEGAGPIATLESLTSYSDTQADQPDIEQADAATEYFANDEPVDSINESEARANDEVESDTEAQLATETKPAAEAEHAEFFAALEESLDEIEETDEIAELKAIAELDALDSVAKAARQEEFDETAAIFTQAESGSESGREQVPTEQIAAALQTEDGAVSGPDTPKESPLVPTPEPATPAPTQRPEDVSLSISFSMQPRPTAPGPEAAADSEAPTQTEQAAQLQETQDRSASNSTLVDAGAETPIEFEPEAAPDAEEDRVDAASPDNLPADEPPETEEAPSELAFSEPEIDPFTAFSEKTVILETDTLRAAEQAEQDFNEAIKEQDFAETVATGFAIEESMDAQLHSSLDWHLASAEGNQDKPDTIETGADEQSQETLQTTDPGQNTEPESLELSEENSLAGTDVETPHSGSLVLEQDDIALPPVANTAASLTESTKPTESTAIETPVFFSSDELEAGETSAIDSAAAQDPLTDQTATAAESRNEQDNFRDNASEDEAEDSSEDIRARALRAQLLDDEALEQLPEENLAALKVMATPLELGSGQRRRWGATLGLGLLACLLGVGIAGQYLWRHNSVFSQEPMLRPLFVSTCQLLSCSLEPYSNLAAIVSSNLSVRSHPERADAIMVNVEMRNTAPFEQAFPIMVLGFNTASNDLVALREFTPDEYLDSGLQGVTQMPVMAPVQIGLALMDPGNDAVNYTLAFRLP